MSTNFFKKIISIFSKKQNIKRIIFFSYHYPPDQSAGAIRTKGIVEELLKIQSDVKIWVFTSLPNRYGKRLKEEVNYNNKSRNMKVIRFWVPIFGSSNHLLTSISYAFYFIQSIPRSILIQPSIIVGTSGKLLTSFAATCSAKLTKATLFIDYRDTFTDNFFYFYRWQKKIIFQCLLILIENIVFRSADYINIVSFGFKDAFTGYESKLKKKSYGITCFTNGIDKNFKNRIIESTALKSKDRINTFKIIYAGNLGDGQDIYSLLVDLKNNSEALTFMIKNKIKLDIYGAGSQLDLIKNIVSSGKNKIESNSLSDIVSYCGFVSRNNIHNIYRDADCLMINIARFLPLSLVIPSKVFECTATPYPIIFGASGFTKSFISEIDGTFSYTQNDSKSLIKAVKEAISCSPEIYLRRQFLEKYDSANIYKLYAQHILGND